MLQIHPLLQRVFVLFDEECEWLRFSQILCVFVCGGVPNLRCIICTGSTVHAPCDGEGGAGKETLKHFLKRKQMVMTMIFFNRDLFGELKCDIFSSHPTKTHRHTPGNGSKTQWNGDTFHAAGSCVLLLNGASEEMGENIRRQFQ